MLVGAPRRRWLLASVVALVALPVAGCEDKEGAGGEQAASSDCLRVTPELKASIESGLVGGRKLGSIAVVEGTPPDSPPILQAEAYYLVAEVEPSPGRVVWVIDADMLKTGGGIIAAADSAARAASNLGDRVEVSRLNPIDVEAATECLE